MIERAGCKLVVAHQGHDKPVNTLCALHRFLREGMIAADLAQRDAVDEIDVPAHKLGKSGLRAGAAIVAEEVCVFVHRLRSHTTAPDKTGQKSLLTVKTQRRKVQPQRLNR